MNSSKCPECGFVGWADAESCKRCGAHLAVQPVDASAGPAPGETVYYAPPPGGIQPKLNQGMAVTAMVLGILNFLGLGLFGFTIIVGIVISVVAMNNIKRYPHMFGGRSFALTGLIMNIASVVVLIPVMIILSIALPNLHASRRAANEGSAIKALRTIASAEATYQYAGGNGSYGTLEDLQRQYLIEADLVSGTRNGYQFKVEIVKDAGDGLPGFTAVAVPVSYPYSGRLSFFLDETGVIRAADSQGTEATRHDPPLNLDRDRPSNRSASRRSRTVED